MVITAVPAARGRAYAAVALVVVCLAAFEVYVWSLSGSRSARLDFYYLADAFLHGRLWLAQQPAPFDIVVVDGRSYVPSAPFPAVLLLPLVAIAGPTAAGAWEPIVNCALATAGLALLWRLAARLEVASLEHRAWLVALFGFSTAHWWVTSRGGLWHTSQLVASLITFAGLLEAFGRRRPLVMGLLAGIGFATRAPLAAALPYWGWRSLPGGLRATLPRVRGDGLRRLTAQAARLAVGFAPILLLVLWYDAARFGNPLETGYGLAALSGDLDALRRVGLFSLAHLPMNLDYLLLHLGRPIATFPWFEPDGYGLSILVTSPGLLLAARANWRDRETWALGLTALVVLAPSLVYYGGGFFQFGYRYALDAIPFVMALCAMAAARHGMGPGWKALIAVGIAVNFYGIWWGFHA
jgi:hypothetical protein